MELTPPFLSLSIIADRIGVPGKWLKQEAVAGRIPHIKIGSKFLASQQHVVLAIQTIAGKAAGLVGSGIRTVFELEIVETETNYHWLLNYEMNLQFFPLVGTNFFFADELSFTIVEAAFDCVSNFTLALLDDRSFNEYLKADAFVVGLLSNGWKHKSSHESQPSTEHQFGGV